MKKKLKLSNRNRESISIILDIQKNQEGLVFIMHGLGGFKEQEQVQAFAAPFKEKKFTTIVFDARNTFGESQGNYEEANATNYFQDLEDVISWAKKQEWYQEPFYLAGHSLGGLCILLYTEKFPEKIKAIVPISTVVSGKLLIAAYPQESLEEWERTGWRISPSNSRQGVIKKLKWPQFKEDILKYDVTKKISLLNLPVLLIVGEKDTTHKEDQERLYKLLPGEKELHIIKDAEHTFHKEQEFKQIKKILNDWIPRVEKAC